MQACASDNVAVGSVTQSIRSGSVSSAHLRRSVDSVQPVHCSWMGFAGSASPSLWLGNLSRRKSYTPRIRSTKRRRLGRIFSRNAQSIVTSVFTILTARGQFTLQAERARPQPQAPKWFDPTSLCQIHLPGLLAVCHLAVHRQRQ